MKCFNVEKSVLKTAWGIPFSTYTPRGRGGGVKRLIHFHCILHAKKGGGGPDSMSTY